MQRRMRAAEAALPYMHPELSVVANVNHFADQMKEIARRSGRSNVIDAPRAAIPKGPIPAAIGAVTAPPSGSINVRHTSAPLRT